MLVNVWLDHHPKSVAPFPSNALEHMGKDLELLVHAVRHPVPAEELHLVDQGADEEGVGPPCTSGKGGGG